MGDKKGSKNIKRHDWKKNFDVIKINFWCLGLVYL